MEPILLTAEEEGLRLDLFLASRLEEVTRSAAQKLLEEGRVVCSGTSLQKKDRTRPGAVYEIHLPDPVPLDVIPQNLPLDIRLEDEDLVVINKPVGMVVHPAPGHPDGTLVNALLHHCGSSLSGINGVLRPGIVHRIDRDTSGLIIVAKNDAAHLSLAEQLQDHSLYREYRAVCVGGLREEAGTISAPIARHRTHRKKMAIDREGRPAVTHWKVLEPLGRYTYLQCRLETGRTHQIRVHLASIGHPLLGDVVYGSPKPWPGLAGQCLHAGRLTFRHPRTGALCTVEAENPPWFEDVLTKLRKQV